MITYLAPAHRPTADQQLAPEAADLEELPIALAAESLPIDEQINALFRDRFLGAVALEEAVQLGVSEEHGPTLATAAKRAAEGDPEANALLDINIATAVAEACFKDGYISRVTKQIGENGEILQHGTNLHQI